MRETARKSSPTRPPLSVVPCHVPSSPPDTSDLDADWADDGAPRRSFLGLKDLRRASVRLPEPPPLPDHRRPGVRSRELSTSVRPASLSPCGPFVSDLGYDVWNGPSAVLVLLELPGVSPDELSLTLGSHTLHIEVEVPEGQRPGVAAGRHEVAVELPEGLHSDAVDAVLAQGVLRVRISKLEAGPRKVAIESYE